MLVTRTLATSPPQGGEASISGKKPRPHVNRWALRAQHLHGDRPTLGQSFQSRTKFWPRHTQGLPVRLTTPEIYGLPGSRLWLRIHPWCAQGHGSPGIKTEGHTLVREKAAQEVPRAQENLTRKFERSDRLAQRFLGLL